MRAFDFTPLYRSGIGFDRLAHLFDEAQRLETLPSQPPYNIELVEQDQYLIQMAVTGFDRSELDLQSEGDTLTVIGRKRADDSKRTYLHRGITARDFEQRFQLADHVKVVSAKLDQGVLTIALVREVPEALKPRRIVIDGADNVHLIERKAA